MGVNGYGSGDWSVGALYPSESPEVEERGIQSRAHLLSVHSAEEKRIVL